MEGSIRKNEAIIKGKKGQRPGNKGSYLEAINRQPLVITVAVGTKASNVTQDYPTNARASAKETGLPEDTVFLCFLIRFLDPSRFIDPRTGRANMAGTMPAKNGGC